MRTLTKIDNIQGCDIWRMVEDGKEYVMFVSDLDVDCDGTGGNPYHDPYFQPDTRLHYKGKALHAETVPYFVVPPIILQKTLGVVMGSLVEVLNLKNGDFAMAVVGDSGPRTKIGEGSPKLAELLGLSGNPNSGGTSEKIIWCKIHVGVPAEIDGVQYDLQSA